MKVHQNVVIDGVDLGAPARKGSKFTNEGKWDNFIKPLLPDGEVFIEYGSNAGMFLKLAQYRQVIGLERSKNDCKVAVEYRGDNDYQIIQADINKYDLDTLPLADVTLLANFHYHQEVSEFMRLLNILENRTCYVIIVSVGQEERKWRAQPFSKDVKHYFRHWELVKEIRLPDEKDPYPRPMYSMLFKSPKIERVPLEKIIVKNSTSREYEYHRRFVRDTLLGKNYKETDYYRIQARRKRNKWSQETLNTFMEGKYQLVKNVSAEGIREPLVVDRNFNLVDGTHRYFTLLELGQSAIIRVL